MGQQQLLLIILGVLIVGIAISVGVAGFIGGHQQANKDALIAKLTGIAADAFHYHLRPSSMGGGGNSYVGYQIPSKLVADENGTYALGTLGTTTAVITSVSSLNTAWTATCTVDDTGSTMIICSGW
jgi:hypothetical protein